jgi:thiamine pyrophosphate-dependent acetolactate synthase large subunit-like protein
MPKDTIYIDEVTTHTATLRQHLVWNDPQCLFTRQGGLGQGLGLSLGIKLGKPERQVVTLIGDGAFLYNPSLGSLGAARDYKLPIMAVIFNNKKYAAMQGMHQKMYPDGIAVEIDLYHGTQSGEAPGCAEARPRSQPQRQAGDYRRYRYIDDTRRAVASTLATALPERLVDQLGFGISMDVAAHLQK